MLTRIRLENFKNWAELDLTLGNLTLLFGTNSSGKTSVLHALLLLKQTVMGFDRHQPMNLGGGDTDLVDLGSYRDLVFGHNEDKHVSVELVWRPIDISARRSLSIEIGIRGGREWIQVDKFTYFVEWRQLADRVVVENLRYQVFSPETEEPSIFFHMTRHNEDQYTLEASPVDPEEKQPPSFPTDNITDRGKTIPLESCYAMPRFLPVLLFRVAFDPSILSREFESLIKNVAYLGPLRDYPSRTYSWRGTAPQEVGPRGEKTIDALLAFERSRSRRKPGQEPVQDLLVQVSDWLAKMGLVSELQIKPIDKDKRFYKPRVHIAEGGPESSLIDVGFGVSQVLPIVTLLFFAPEGSIVLLEQPELHLHPSAQAHLADLFLHVAQTRGLQLIVESHSEHLLRRLQRRVAEAEHPLATPEHLKMYFCETKAEGATASPVKVDKYGQIANWPENFFGDIDGDLDALTDAVIARRRRELSAK